MSHVDEFIEDYEIDAYARFVLHLFRLPAALQIAFKPFIQEHRLFCSWKGGRYRVTGASRLGDIWLNRDFDRDHGYHERVDVAECTAWGPAP